MTKTDRTLTKAPQKTPENRPADGFNPFGCGPDPIGLRDSATPKRDAGLVH